MQDRADNAKVRASIQGIKRFLTGVVTYPSLDDSNDMAVNAKQMRGP